MKDVNVLELDGLVISSCCSELVVVQCETHGDAWHTMHISGKTHHANGLVGRRDRRSLLMDELALLAVAAVARVAERTADLLLGHTAFGDCGVGKAENSLRKTNTRRGQIVAAEPPAPLVARAGACVRACVCVRVRVCRCMQD